jgi:hypothetical protein
MKYRRIIGACLIMFLELSKLSKTEIDDKIASLLKSGFDKIDEKFPEVPASEEPKKE